jgi:hypothetical protein
VHGTLNFDDSCPTGSYNFGSGLLGCSNCAWYTPALLHDDDCKSTTGTFTNIKTQTALEVALMFDRTLKLGADIIFTDTVYMLHDPSEAALTGLVIDGKGLFSIDGGSAVRCIYVYGIEIEITFRSLTISNGYVSSSGAAVYIGASSGTFSMTDCTVIGNSAYAGHGGGIEISAAISFSFERCTFDGNYARYDGGALRAGSGATGTLVDCTFRNNRANRYGGAIGVYTSSTTLTFLNYEFVGNDDSDIWHEDIYRLNSATVDFEAVCPEGSHNFGSGWLQCLNCESYVPVLLKSENCKNIMGLFTITTQDELEYSLMINRILELGADISLTTTVYMLTDPSKDSLTGLVIDGKGLYSVDGGNAVRCFFVYGSGMEITFRSMTISNGYVSSSSQDSKNGAAVFIGGSSGTFHISDVTITSCTTASGSGGAIYVESSLAVLSMTDCTLVSNSASSGYGGSMEIRAAVSFSFERCTFDGNYARYDGGALRVGSGATGLLVDCIFRNNHAYRYGGAIGIYTSSTTLTFFDYEFVGNYDSSSLHEDIYRLNSATVDFEDVCPEGSHNFGSSWLECPNCVSPYFPAVLHDEGCKNTTGLFTITSQDELEYSLMINRTLELGADISLTTTVYMLSGPSKDSLTGLVIDGKGLYSVDGGNAVRCFFVYGSGMEIIFRNMSISNGYVSSSSQDSMNGAAVFIGGSSGTFHVSDVAITSCTSASGYGGGIEISAAIVFSFERCTFDSNYARYDGGALRVGSGATGLLVDCVFKDNHAYRYGGAIGIYTTSTTLTFLDYEFVGNYDSSSLHEDIYRLNSATLNFKDVCLEGLYNFGSSWLECPNCVSPYFPAVLHGEDCKNTTGLFTNITTQDELEYSLMINRTLELGADISLKTTVYLLYGPSGVALTGLMIDGKGLYSVNGGNAVRCFFVYGSGMEIIFRNMTISNGYVSSSSQDSMNGAAVFIGGSSGTFHISDVTITSCTSASGSGGAIYVESSLAVFGMTDCTLVSNSVSSGYGGSMEISAAVSFSFERCTFDGNHARYDGGALRVGSGATGLLVDCIFRNNHAYRYGGAIGIYTSSTTLTFFDYEFVGNYDSSSLHEDIYRLNSATVDFEDVCKEDLYNFGSSWLECPNCELYVPAVLHDEDCKNTTGLFTNITTQSELEYYLMVNRTLELGADIYLTGAVYMLSGPSEDSLTGLIIDGMGLYSVDGGNAVRCFVLHVSTEFISMTVSFMNLTMINGKAQSTTLDGSLGGAIYVGSGIEILISRSTISSCNAYHGSGIYVASYSVLSMNFCTFYNNRGATAGGGLYFSGSSATLAHMDFLSNDAISGGGAYFSAGTITLTIYTFSSNAGTNGEDLFISSNSIFSTADGCSYDFFNFGSGFLLCDGCSIEHLPAHLETQILIPSPLPTSLPSQSSAPTYLPTSLPSQSSAPSQLPTPSPSLSFAPTPLPTLLPSQSPTSTPLPTFLPSLSSAPSQLPTPIPSQSYAPTSLPTLLPSHSTAPTPLPTSLPTLSSAPSQLPTPIPSQSSAPTPLPTLLPSQSSAPTQLPSMLPSQSSAPSQLPTPTPSQSPTSTQLPTLLPSQSSAPSQLPTPSPSQSSAPTPLPTSLPSQSSAPSQIPSLLPSQSSAPTQLPTLLPSQSSAPSQLPTPPPSQ